MNLAGDSRSVRFTVHSELLNNINYNRNPARSRRMNFFVAGKGMKKREIRLAGGKLLIRRELRGRTEFFASGNRGNRYKLSVGRFKVSAYWFEFFPFLPSVVRELDENPAYTGSPGRR